jgi:hypothetical protein
MQGQQKVVILFCSIYPQNDWRIVLYATAEAGCARY